MKANIENFGTGWYGLRVNLNTNDIDRMIAFLRILKNDDSYHFHLFSTTFDIDTGGVSDIQFSRKYEGELSNMDIGA